jgi:hypothetical protein
MKLYLSEEQFVDLFWKTYERKMSDAYTASVGDAIAWRIFQEFDVDTKDTLAGAMWNLEEFDDPLMAVHIIGAKFHKSFRQVGPIDAPLLNGIVWTALRDAPMFWSSLDKACKALTNEEVSRYALEEE